jgi:clan AA aspartic protease
MGLVFATLGVRGANARARSVEFLIDSGAIYSVLPREIWRSLGLRAKRSMDFTLADGSHVTRPVSEATFAYEGVEAASPVILGGVHDAAVLGAVTLETLALVLNPFERTLRPWRRMPLRSFVSPGRSPGARTRYSPATEATRPSHSCRATEPGVLRPARSFACTTPVL